MRYEAVVVGGGISGMTSALILARRGMRVALVERDHRLAPVLRGFRRNGLRFDTGLHYTGGLGPNGPLLRYFLHLGILPGLELKPYPEDGFDELRFRDTGLAFLQPFGRERFEEALNRSFPGNGDAIKAYFQELDREWADSPYLNPERSFPDEPLSLAHDERSLLGFLDRLTRDDALKAVLSAHSILYGVPPERALLRVHAQVAGSYLHAVHGISGGGLALTRRYEERIAEHDVALFLGRQARRLCFDSAGNLAGLRLDNGEELYTARCVFTAPPASLPGMTPETVFRPGYRKRMRGLRNCHSSAMLFGRLRRTPDALRRRNILEFPTSDPRTMYPAPGRLDDSPVFLGRAGEQGEMTAMICVPEEVREEWLTESGRRTKEYSHYKEGLRTRFLDILVRRFPEVAETLEPMDFATPLTFRDFGCLPRGGIYGAEHAAGQYPVLPMTKVEGLVLAGQSVIAPGVLGAVISAYVACGILVGRETLRKEVLACS
ncbi:phytoene desaturase family protein [Paucidesulfovibrio longus]|uniref:phytoene desaturase family protein n=1 Tax=Paucidesulfovibrio longus TaxID=889 RepID=UPI00058B4A47|nr:NAD(P)/FAD-dependent oxidoreductase [Paucidesulfovibrio longus]